LQRDWKKLGVVGPQLKTEKQFATKARNHRKRPDVFFVSSALFRVFVFQFFLNSLVGGAGSRLEVAFR
jgi:hypothetical protein